MKKAFATITLITLLAGGLLAANKTQTPAAQSNAVKPAANAMMAAKKPAKKHHHRRPASNTAKK